MDWFSIFLEVFTLGGLSILHIVFVARISGKEGKIWHMAGYFLMLCLCQKMLVMMKVPDFISIAAEMLVLYIVSRDVLENERAVSCVSSVLAIYITELSSGIMNSIEIITFGSYVGDPLLYLLIILATAASFALSICCYSFVLKFISLEEGVFKPYIGLLLLSGLFFCSAELYILQTAYTYVSVKVEPGKHLMLLSLQLLGLGAFLCTLYAYGRACSALRMQAALFSLSQAAQAQKSYVVEAQLRYEKTRAFRHDFKNHLSVLDGLLNTDRIEEAKDYLKKLEAVSTALSFPYQTGNPVVDILLGEKVELARLQGIRTEVSLVLPKVCGIDDFDLCVIFANGFDNAIEACQLMEDDKRFISIRGERQGDFYMLEFQNTCKLESAADTVVIGTGLSNIQSVAEKYHGAMLTEKTKGLFRLNVLLNISGEE